ncbi:MAG: PQQ-binding-like beta-propeller repeat protein [Opitutales bacterium]
MIRGSYFAAGVLLVVGGTSFISNASASDWPQFRGPERNGASSSGELLSQWPEMGPQRLWTKDVGTGVSAFVVADGVAYTLGNVRDRGTGRWEDVVYALDAETGDEKWTFKYEIAKAARQFEGGPASTPAYGDGMLYTLSHEGHLHALNAHNGELAWKKHLVRDLDGDRPRWGFSSAPLVVGDFVVVEPGGRNASLVALDRRTGEVKWRAGNSGAGYASPVVHQHRGKDIILAFNAFGLEGYTVEDGRRLFQKRWETAYDVNAATPLAMGDKVFISSGYGKGSALVEIDASSTEQVWAHSDFMNQLTSSVLHDGFLYGFHVNHVGNRRGHALKCVELETGKVRWSEDGLGSGSLILVDGQLVILTTDGELVVVDATPSRYSEKERMQALPRQSWVEPAYADGIVFLRNNSGKSAAFRIGES